MAFEVTIDRFGRILVPKALRERAGWNPGLALHLIEEGDGLRVVPAAAPSGAGVTVQEGRVVYDAAWFGPAVVARDDVPAWNPPPFDTPKEIPRDTP